MKRLSRAQTIALFLLILSSAMAYAIANLAEADLSEYVEATFVKVSGTTIYVGNNCTAIVAETTEERAASIEDGMKGIINERPTIHDTFTEVLKSFNITLDYVTIDRYDSKFYYSSLVLNSGDKVLKIDTKPSDAIAMAARTNSSIYINRTMLQDIGENVC